MFGADRLTEVQRIAYRYLRDILERDPTTLTMPARRLFLLDQFERETEIKLQGEMRDLIMDRLASASTNVTVTESLKLFTMLNDFLTLLARIRHGYGVRRIARCSVLVKPESDHEDETLRSMSKLGFSMHLPGDYSYLDKSLEGEDHFIVPCIMLKQSTALQIKSVVDDEVKRNHNIIQRILVELGKALGYRAEKEYHLSIPQPRLDVALTKHDRLVKAFEIQFQLDKRSLLGALYNLMKAYESGAEIYLVIPNTSAMQQVKSLIQSDRPQLVGIMRILTADQVVKLYEAIRQGRSIVSLLR